MNYSITGADDQALVMDKLRGAGAEVIQSSGGLICKSELSAAEIVNLIGNESARVEEVSDFSQLSPDVKKFLGR